jgi:hypothetical protein
MFIVRLRGTSEVAGTGLPWRLKWMSRDSHRAPFMGLAGLHLPDAGIAGLRKQHAEAFHCVAPAIRSAIGISVTSMSSLLVE